MLFKSCRLPSKAAFFFSLLPVFSATLSAAVLLCACSAGATRLDISESPSFFSVDSLGGKTVIVSISPFDGSRDSLIIEGKVGSVVCMSSTAVAAFAELGCSDMVRGVSGKNFISNPLVSSNPLVKDVGSDAAPDYETIVSLNPDLVLAYAVSSVLPPYVERLNSLGIRTLILYDNFESHPLARAAYIRLAGALAACPERADSVFDSISASYRHIRDSLGNVVEGARPGVLVNAPYADAWYIPGKRSYMYRLVWDAGAEILGAAESSLSSTISIEQALDISRSADFWLHPGNARTRKELLSMHPFFGLFLHPGLRIYNNTLRMNPGGGNDFYERGAVRPDLVLNDLKNIFLSGYSEPVCASDCPQEADSVWKSEYYLEVE